MSGAQKGFVRPMRYIFDLNGLHAFQQSKDYEDLIKFIGAICVSIIDKSNNDSCEISVVSQSVINMLAKFESWIDEIPPIQQPMRYGNKAFRDWHNRLLQELVPLVREFIPTSLSGAEIELAAYLCDSFGNATRIDYGTGHETTFIIFLFAMCKLGLFKTADLTCLGIKVFPAYIRVVRRLQRTYWLEPAGSHGVWSLDDYQFLVYVFGSAQLLNHKHIRPRSIHSSDTLEACSGDYMYLAAISAINEVKTGAPFAEHSPMLNDIAELPSWKNVHDGLAKMYVAEVLGKVPVVQHFVFGSLFSATWIPQRDPIPSDSVAHLYMILDGVDPNSGAPNVVRPSSSGANARATISGQLEAIGIPENTELPIDHSGGNAVAPWASSPKLGSVRPSPSQSVRPLDSSIARLSPSLQGASGSSSPVGPISLDNPTSGAAEQAGELFEGGVASAISFVHAFGQIPHVYAGSHETQNTETPNEEASTKE